MTDRSRVMLILFNERAVKLRSRSFTKLVEERGTSLSWNFELGKPLQMNFVRPDSEAIEALVVTLRMFMQKKENVSFRNMNELVADPEVSMNWKDQFRDVRRRLNEWLDQPGTVKMEVEGRVLPRRDILDTFINGDIAHSSPKERKLYLQWKGNDALFQIMEYEFSTLLMRYLEFVFYMQDINFLEIVGDSVPALG